MADLSSDESDAGATGDTATGGFVQWFLLDANRFAIAVAVAGGIGLTYLTLTLFGAAPLTDEQAIFYAFSG